GGNTVIGGAGNDSVSFSYAVNSQVDLGDGADTLYASSVHGSVINMGTTDAGEDSISVSEAVGASISTGGGNDTAYLYSVHGSTIGMGAGDDSLSLTYAT